jgi:phospholipid/cholesterol/gamma-HCH transport system substrate-binding protein
MSKSRYEWKVGLFVLIGLVLLAVLMLQFSKGASVFRKTYHILLQAANVGGLKERALVLMAGVQVGTISEIKLGPQGTNVTITLKIYQDYQIYKDARFVLEMSGFLGDQYVAIIPTKNQGPLFQNNDVAQAEAPFNLQEVARSASGFIQRLDETAKRLNEAIIDVRLHVLNEQTLTNLADSIGNLKTFSEEALVTVEDLRGLMRSNSPALSASGSNLVVFSKQLTDFADRLNGVLDTNTPSINAAVKNIESSTVVLNNLLNDVQAGKGLVGSLIKDEEMAIHVSQISSNLSITSSNLNRLGLWGILWQRKPPKTTPPPRSVRSPKKSSG